VGQRIIDAVAEINRDAAMTKRIGTYTLSEADPLRPDSADSDGGGGAHSSDSSFTLTRDDPSKKYDVSVGGVSLTTVILHLRELFGQSDTRISGEIIVEHPPAAGIAGKDQKPAAKKFSIRLRITDKGHVQHEAEATDKLDTLFEQAALKLVERFEPLNAAYYGYHQRDHENALRIVRAYLVDQTAKKETRWALNLLGLIEHVRYRHDEARAEKGYDDAIAVFEKLKQDHPRFAPALYNLGFVLTDKGRRHLKGADTEAARALFRKAHEVALEGIRIDEAAGKSGPDRAVGYATAGRALRYLGRLEPASYDEALRWFERSTEADPMFVYAYLSQGWIYDHRGAPDDALAKYQLATEINPSARTFRRAGSYLRRNDRHPESVQMFQRAAELEPSAGAYASWGTAVRDSGRPEEAKGIFERAIATDPNSPNGYNQLGLVYLDETKWDEAAENFAKASRLSPRWSNYQYNLGLALRRARKFDQAITAFEKAIAIYPSHAWSQAQLGATLAERDCQNKRTVAEETARTVEEKLRKAAALKPGDSVVGETVRHANELLNCPKLKVEPDRSASSAGERAHGGLEADERPGRTIGSF
jgi:tetratricopeptide (TPR) repeat protein